MKAKDFVDAYSRTHGGAMFGNVSDIARFLAVDRHSVSPLLYGLKKFNRNYFIPEAAERICEVMKHEV